MTHLVVLPGVLLDGQAAAEHQAAVGAGTRVGRHPRRVVLRQRARVQPVLAVLVVEQLAPLLAARTAHRALVLELQRVHAPHVDVQLGATEKPGGRQRRPEVSG